MYNVPIYTIGGTLCHHGILGQKWGQKNGPPYPLDSSDHSVAEKKAGWRKSLSKKQNKDKRTYTIAELDKKAKSDQDLSSDEYRVLYEHKMKVTSKKYPGFEKWLLDNDLDLVYDVKDHDYFVDMYKKKK